MQTNFIQPSGNTSVQSSAEVFSQLLNIPLSTITALDKNVDLTNFSFAVDPASKEIFSVSAVTGVVSGINISGTVATITTDKGVFQGAAFPAALTTVSIATIADLRKFKPLYNGQTVRVKGYYADQNTGGGMFIGSLTNAVDDGGVTFSGVGFHWSRVNTSSLSPLDYGVVPGKTSSASVAIQNIINLGNTEIDLGGLTYGIDKSISVTNNNTRISNGCLYVMDTHTEKFVFGLNAQYCIFDNLWADLNGTTAAGYFSSIDPVKGVSGVTPCESLVSNQGVSHYTKIINTYVTRSSGGKPAFSFAGVDQCLNVSVVDCTVEFSGSMFFTMSANNEVINPRCLNINDAGIAFNTGGAKNCVVRGGFVHNCRYGGIAVESGAHDIVIDGVTFTQPQSDNASANFVVQSGDILISSFTSNSADCYNVDIINCKFNQGSNGSASTSSNYKRSIYIVNGYNINIKNNTFITTGYLNDNTEENNCFIYLNPGISRGLSKLCIENNNIKNGCLVKMWSSVNADVGEISIIGNTFKSVGYVFQVVAGNTTAYYPGTFLYSLRVYNNFFTTTKMIAGTSSSKIYQWSEWINNIVPPGDLKFLDGTQKNALFLRQIKAGNSAGEYLSDTLPATGTWSIGEIVKVATVAPSGNIGWVCTGTGTFTSTSWAASTAYTLGSRVVKGTSVYEALVAGTSGTTGPVGTVVNATETDGTVTWKLIGPATPTFISLGTYGSA